MTEQDRNFTDDSTIYSYKLVRRIHNNYLVVMMLILLVMLALIGNVVQERAFTYMLCFPGILVLYSLVTFAYLRTVYRDNRIGWRFGFNLFWVGLVPTSYCSYSLMKGLQMHLFFGGLFVICALYPWIGFAHWANLLFVHGWFMIPRFIVLFLLRPYRKNGLIKIHANDTSCYMP